MAERKKEEKRQDSCQPSFQCFKHYDWDQSWPTSLARLRIWVLVMIALRCSHMQCYAMLPTPFNDWSKYSSLKQNWQTWIVAFPVQFGWHWWGKTPDNHRQGKVLTTNFLGFNGPHWNSKGRVCSFQPSHPGRLTRCQTQENGKYVRHDGSFFEIVLFRSMFAETRFPRQ